MIRSRESKSAPVGVVTKVLRILETLHEAPSGLQLKNVAQLTAINKSTAYRFLAHLENEDMCFAMLPALMRLEFAWPGWLPVLRIKPLCASSAVPFCNSYGAPPASTWTWR